MVRQADPGPDAGLPDPSASSPGAAGGSLSVPRRLDPFYCMTKRLVDLVGSSAGIAICLLPWAVAAVLIKFESPGPVFFIQDRVGEHGRRFRFFKLRTMFVDAEARKALLEHENEMDASALMRRPSFSTSSSARCRWSGRARRW